MILSSIYWVTDRNDRALTTIDSAVALDPDGPPRAVRAVYRLMGGDTAGAMADARLTAAEWPSRGIIAVFARDSAAVRAIEAWVAQSGCSETSAMYLLLTARREQAVQYLLACGPSLRTRWLLRWPAFAPLADDPRIQALRAETERILARARWR
jgi:hypothetical protein